MRGAVMTCKIIIKLNYVSNILAFLVVIGGGVFFHVLTALTIYSIYGFPWGFLAFFLPGVAEVFLSISLCVNEGINNYTIVLVAFLCIAAVKGAIWFGIKHLKGRLTRFRDYSDAHP
jgi:hypothetical protein